MKKILFPILLLCSFLAKSQEIISNINYVQYSLNQNSSSKNSQSQAASFVSSATFVYFYDTLILPFLDDFSTNKLKKYGYPRDSIFNTIPTNLTFFYRGGLCISNTSPFQLMRDTSWTYTFNTADFTIDSFPKNSFEVQFYNDTTNSNANCNKQTSAISVWQTYYNQYTFDTITGNPKDSVAVSADTTLFLVLDSAYLDTTYWVKNDISALWTDNYAFVNNTYPINPITLGVATLDGLDSIGNYYDPRPQAYGQADFLTSKPIDLSVWNISDSIHFSFFWEAQGNGDYPNLDDSLVVEFKNKNGDWEIQWSKRGPDTIAIDTFAQVEFAITDTAKYFYKGFQFRFRNKATISGNNDHWHIDYVSLSVGKYIIQDFAFTLLPPSLLANYLSMPYNQYKADSIKEIPRKITIKARSNYFAQESIFPYYEGREIISGIALDTYSAPISLGLLPNSDTIIDLDSLHIPAYLQQDSVLIRVKYSLNPNIDILHLNDSAIAVDYPLYNYFAYDDGTAEKSYGLFGSGMKFAYEFNLNVPDTLQAIQFHFVHYNANVANKEFGIMVWQSITPGTTKEIVLDTLFDSPKYIDTANGLFTYKLTQPLLLPAGKFYIGWQQIEDDLLNIGFDVNDTLGRQHAYYTNYQDGGNWTQSRFKGAVMIRPLTGKPLTFKWIYPPAKPVVEKIASALSIFPNPLSDYLDLRAVDGIMPEVRMEIYNYMGVKLLEKNYENKPINVQSLNNGFYILRVINKENGEQTILKFIKL